MARPTSGYRINGHRVPGVTTIIGRFKDSGALLWWAFGQGQAAQRGEINSLYDKRDEAANAGTIAHDMFETHILGGDKADIEQHLDGATDAVRAQARQGYANAVDWLRDTRIEITDTERALVSKEYRFGGTVDAVGRDSQGNVILLDWKTSGGVYADYLIQLAAYGWLLKENDGIDVSSYHLARFDKVHADFAHHKWSDLSDAWEQFKLFRQAYDLDKNLKKRA